LKIHILLCTTMNIKAKNGWSNTSVNDLLKFVFIFTIFFIFRNLLNIFQTLFIIYIIILWFYLYYRLLNEKLFSSDNVIPSSCRKAQKILKDVGVPCVSYHSFVNDCILYRGWYEKLSVCPKSGANRYHPGSTWKNIPLKVVLHLPIINRFIRMYKCDSLAQYMNWHAKNRSEENVITHSWIFQSNETYRKYMTQ